ncbi:MAG: hypothetical protein C0467_07050 [Planctomycetaceae bacterium]|nr:hypothetical protein [Planctomycetaceae bacterium]
MDSEAEQRHAERFKTMMRAWLATLPKTGWSGSPTELADTIYLFAKSNQHYVYVPEGKGIARALQPATGAIYAAGWLCTERRTGRGRFIEFKRVAAVRSGK